MAEGKISIAKDVTEVSLLIIYLIINIYLFITVRRYNLID